MVGAGRMNEVREWRGLRDGRLRNSVNRRGRHNGAELVVGVLPGGSGRKMGSQGGRGRTEGSFRRETNSIMSNR